MSDSEKEELQEPEKPRRYKWRYGPIRLAMPWISVAVGILSVVRNSGGIGRGGSHDTTFSFVFGLALIAAGIIFFFVYRWMAKRGI